MELVFATTNKGKMAEIRKLFEGTSFTVLSLEDLNICVDVVEDGTTFEENAIKKATEMMNLTGKIVLSDDSGLEIDFLDKNPGVYSARYLGETTPYAEKNKIVLEKMADVPTEKRTARFVSVIAAAFPDGKVWTTRGTLEGLIHTCAMGGNGFGYDPIFFVPEYNQTLAEMPMALKNQISHRGKALEQMKVLLLKEGERDKNSSI